MSGIIDISNIANSYIPVAIILIVAIIMPPVMMFLVKMLSPRSKSLAKYTTYEAGSLPKGDARIQYNVQYYLYAIAFVVFDVALLFLYPWATIFMGHGITWILTIKMAVFVFILLFGYVYLVMKEDLKWMK